MPDQHEPKPAEVQRFLWEADQLTYEPPETAPEEHGAHLLAPLGEYVRVEDLAKVRTEEHQRVREALESDDTLNRVAQAIAGHVTTDDEMQQDFCLEIARDVLDAALKADESPASHFAHRFQEDHWPR